jgi:hypothetical protein
LCGCIGLFGDLLGDHPWEINLTRFVTQQREPGWIAEKDER